MPRPRKTKLLTKKKAGSHARRLVSSAKTARKRANGAKPAQRSHKRTRELELKKFVGNPIIEPRDKNAWESKATFNPGAFFDGEKTYLLYRAIGDTDVSVLGYAATGDGINLDERLQYPVYARREGPQIVHTEEKAAYISGGGWNGGFEDPRLTLIGNRIYMLYTNFDGWGSIRISLTSISLDDFRAKRWKWRKPVFISPPGEINKNWVLFPEKIRGKYAILHSISPKILIDYVDSLENFDGTKFIHSHVEHTTRRGVWDSHVRGAGPTPIKTRIGWLLLYHAEDEEDPYKYKLGAMILDLKDPTKILYRSKEPILEPTDFYEYEGFKSGVTYSCGAVVYGDKLIVYYGAADTVVGVASAPLEEFLEKLTAGQKPKITRARGAAR